MAFRSFAAGNKIYLPFITNHNISFTIYFGTLAMLIYICRPKIIY